MVVSYRQPVHTPSALLNAYTDAGGRDDTDDDGDADVADVGQEEHDDDGGNVDAYDEKEDGGEKDGDQEEMLLIFLIDGQKKESKFIKVCQKFGAKK